MSTREGFLRDFDTMEKAILKARNQLDEKIAEEILSSAAKKQVSGQERKAEVESELGRISVHFLGDMASTMKPKERIGSVGFPSCQQSAEEKAYIPDRWCKEYKEQH